MGKEAVRVEVGGGEFLMKVEMSSELIKIEQ